VIVAAENRRLRAPQQWVLENLAQYQTHATL
jgi:hypothetical protein